MPNDSVDRSSKESSACYPRRTFDPLREGPSTKNPRITRTDFRPCSTRRSHSQAGFCPCTELRVSDPKQPTVAHLRYFLGGHRPSQTAHHAGSPKVRSLGAPGWYLKEASPRGSSHLSCAGWPKVHCRAAVKVHGVLPSGRGYSASSRRLQFHGIPSGDSGAVVTPFVQVGTYPTRNFATLGPLELRPPFTGPGIPSFPVQRQGHPSCEASSTGQVSDPIRTLARWQGPVFLRNSRYP